MSVPGLSEREISAKFLTQEGVQSLVSVSSQKVVWVDGLSGTSHSQSFSLRYSLSLLLLHPHQRSLTLDSYLRIFACFSRQKSRDPQTSSPGDLTLNLTLPSQGSAFSAAASILVQHAALTIGVTHLIAILVATSTHLNMKDLSHGTAEWKPLTQRVVETGSRSSLRNVLSAPLESRTSPFPVMGQNL